MKKRKTIRDIHHNADLPLVCLTAYTAPMAKICDPYVDMLLVGDSVGMVLYGMDSTLAVTLDMMIAHGRAVVNYSKRALVVIDMPFGSYQASKEEAFKNAARVMAETGCQAVKMEGGAEMAETIRYLVERGIPVMGHVGMMPQRVHSYGGYVAQGVTKEQHKAVLADAQRVEEAGAFAVVVECVPEPLARDITKKVAIPTIGIGASVECNGQILVTEDMLGLFGEFTPKFVKRYGELGQEVEKAVEAYAKEVKHKLYPKK